MKTLNTQTIDKPFIDASYYTDTFKPNKNAMIVGSFNNVEQHKADFDAFRNRASEFVDRLTGNEVTAAGGIDFVPVKPRMFLKKAAASLVQHWFISGYVVSDIDNALQIGSLNVRQLKNNETFRKLLPLDTIGLIQKSGMWPGRVFSVEVQEALSRQGIDVQDVLLLSDALQIFQQKGNFDHNFHVDIDYSAELTGLANTDRWIKIVETKNQKISFNITGGELNEHGYTTLFVDKDNFTSGHSEALMFTLQANTEKYFYVENTDNGTLSVYVKIRDDMDKANAHFLISNIYADENGEYKLFGSRTTSQGLTSLNQENILKTTLVNRVDDTKINQMLNTLKGGQ